MRVSSLPAASCGAYQAARTGQRPCSSSLGLLSSRCNSCFLTKLETQQKKIKIKIKRGKALHTRWDWGWAEMSTQSGFLELKLWQTERRAGHLVREPCPVMTACHSHSHSFTVLVCFTEASAPGHFAHIPWNHNSFLNWHSKVFQIKFQFIFVKGVKNTEYFTNWKQVWLSRADTSWWGLMVVVDYLIWSVLLTL